MAIFINCDFALPDEYDYLFEVTPKDKSVFYIYFTAYKTDAKMSQKCKIWYDHHLDHKIIYEFGPFNPWKLFIHQHSDEDKDCRWDSLCGYNPDLPCHVIDWYNDENLTVVFDELEQTLYKRIPNEHQIIVSTEKLTFEDGLQPIAVRKQLSASKEDKRLVMKHNGEFLYFYEGYFDVDYAERFYHYSYRDRICQRMKRHWCAYRNQPSIQVNSVHEFMNNRAVIGFFADEQIYYADCDQIAFPQCYRPGDYHMKNDWIGAFYDVWVDTMCLQLAEQVFAMAVMMCDGYITFSSDEQKITGDANQGAPQYKK